MLGYCHGSHADFETLYKQLAPRLFVYLRRLLRDRPTAEDVLQQTFVKVHTARAAYTPGADPLPWLYTIAYRTCIDELRQRRRSLVRLGRHGEQLESVATFSGRASYHEPNESSDRQQRERMLAALACLTVEQRSALVLTKLQGKSHAEVAALEGVSIGAVKLRTHRACGKLRRQLRSEHAHAEFTQREL
jgi:RNA polymerase sigma factor (sigma-70 family)